MDSPILSYQWPKLPSALDSTQTCMHFPQAQSLPQVTKTSAPALPPETQCLHCPFTYLFYQAWFWAQTTQEAGTFNHTHFTDEETKA